MKQINRIAATIESELLLALFRYVVPFLDKKIKAAKEQKSESRLENLAEQKPKISFNDVKDLESLLLRDLNEEVKSRKNIGVNSGSLSCSLTLRRQKNNKEKSNKYNISIQYEENPSEEKLKVSVNWDGKNTYSVETVNKKETPDKVVPYKIAINYEDNYAEERLTIAYRQQLNSYMRQHLKDKEDMSSRVPLKWLNILPETVMGGVLGFTYLGENFMGRRADLTGKTARMVDIHESIHTPDEYETRVLTSWIMEKAKMNYKK